MTVVLHELGHVLGHGDGDDGPLLSDVMNRHLPAGIRRGSAEVDMLFASDDELSSLLNAWFPVSMTADGKLASGIP